MRRLTVLRVILAALVIVAVLLGANLAILRRDSPTPTACVQFTGAADRIVHFTRELATASSKAANAAATQSSERLSAAIVHLQLLQRSFHDLSTAYTTYEAACLGTGE